LSKALEWLASGFFQFVGAGKASKSKGLLLLYKHWRLGTLQQAKGLGRAGRGWKGSGQ